MKQSSVAERYAKTLYLAADRAGIVDAVLQDYHTLVDLFDKHEEFQHLLANPTVRLARKEEFLKNVLSKHLQELSLNFISLLVRKNRIYFLMNIARAFISLVQTQRGIQVAVVFSSIALNEGQINKLKAHFEKVRGGKFDFENRIDNTLVGGFKIQINDTVIDWSIKNKLESLKKELLA